MSEPLTYSIQTISRDILEKSENEKNQRLLVIFFAFKVIHQLTRNYKLRQPACIEFREIYQRLIELKI